MTNKHEDNVAGFFNGEDARPSSTEEAWPFNNVPPAVTRSNVVAPAFGAPYGEAEKVTSYDYVGTGAVVLTADDVQSEQKEPTFEEVQTAAVARAIAGFNTDPLTNEELNQFEGTGGAPNDWSESLPNLRLALRAQADAIPTKKREVITDAYLRLLHPAPHLGRFLRARKSVV